MGNCKTYYFNGEMGSVGREPRVAIAGKPWKSFFIMGFIDLCAILIIALNNHIRYDWVFTLDILLLIS
jgi:hypothetical protein